MYLLVCRHNQFPFPLPQDKNQEGVNQQQLSNMQNYHMQYMAMIHPYMMNYQAAMFPMYYNPYMAPPNQGMKPNIPEL